MKSHTPTLNRPVASIRVALAVALTLLLACAGFVNAPAALAVMPDLADADITLSQTEYIYDGNPHSPTVTVELDGDTLTEGTDYTVAYSNTTNPGTGTVTVTGVGNYTGTATAHFLISTETQESIDNALIVMLQNAFLHTGSPITPEFAVVLDGNTLLPGTHYTTAYSNNVEIGTATITISGIGRYTGESSTTFMIVDKRFTPEEVLAMLDALPNPLTTLEDADDVVAMTLAFGTLSIDEIESMPEGTVERILAVHQSARLINQNDEQDGVFAHSEELSELWSVRLIVTPRTVTGSPEFFAAIAAQLATTGQIPAALYELSFVETLSGTPWTPTEPVVITFTKVALSGLQNPHVIHQKSDGTLETLPATFDGNTVTFQTTEFSLFGVAAAAPPAPEPAPAPAPAPAAPSDTPASGTGQLAKTGGAANTGLWVGGGVVLLLLAGGALLLVQRKRRSSEPTAAAESESDSDSQL